MNRFTQIARSCWNVLICDIWNEQSVGRWAGLFLSLFTILTTWLTVTYSKDAVLRAGQTLTETKSLGTGVIEPYWGWVTFMLVIVITIVISCGSLISRYASKLQRAMSKKHGRSRLAGFRFLQSTFRYCSHILKINAAIWSLLDFFLVRALAIIAGAGRTEKKARYLQFACVMAAVFTAMLAAQFDMLDAGIGLLSFWFGCFLIFGIVRRWNWVEQDRSSFIVSRGVAERGIRTIKIGFKEDIRSEALIALVLLLLLVPFGLDLVQQFTRQQGGAAFVFDPANELTESYIRRMAIWIAFFGAELAKTIPFVDWSEVFNVKNGSPVSAATPLAAQLIFMLRATLDLLVLSAILQSISTANRQRNQEIAFRSGRLPILDPFSEKKEFKRLHRSIEFSLRKHPAKQRPFIDFPFYDEQRLMELADQKNREAETRIKQVAIVLLFKQYLSDPNSKLEIARFFTIQSKLERDVELRNWFLHIASGLNFELETYTDLGTSNDRLVGLIQNDDADEDMRSAAIRQLGRDKLRRNDAKMIELIFQTSSSPTIQAACALALQKNSIELPLIELKALCEALSLERVVVAQTLAYTLSLRRMDQSAILRMFDEEFRPYAQIATNIQMEPMKTNEALNFGYSSLFQTVAIHPGEAGFPKQFLMGGAVSSKVKKEVEVPQCEVEMSSAFAIGRFPICQAEYHAFLDSMGLQSHGSDEIPVWDEGLGKFVKQDASSSTLPAFELSKFDALAFCDWLEVITGEDWRLPSEIEWEYSCRGGTDTEYYWGDDWIAGLANSNDLAPRPRPTEIGSFPPNAWGLSEMHGNVWEWCADPWHENHEGRPVDDQGPWLEGGDFKETIIRGGCWLTDPSSLRSSYRLRIDSPTTVNILGFRIARTL